MGLFWAALFFIAVQIGLLLEPYLTRSISIFFASQLIEWGEVYTIAFVLSSLLLFVRESKPEFSRFPIVYVSIPFIVILSYLIVYNTILIKNWLLSIYQGGAVVAAIMMYGIYYSRKSVYRTALIGAVLFGLTYLLYLVLPDSYNLIWQSMMAAGIVTLFSGYLLVEHQLETQH